MNTDTQIFVKLYCANSYHWFVGTQNLLYSIPRSVFIEKSYSPLEHFFTLPIIYRKIFWFRQTIPMQKRRREQNRLCLIAFAHWRFIVILQFAIANHSVPADQNNVKSEVYSRRISFEIFNALLRLKIFVLNQHTEKDVQQENNSSRVSQVFVIGSQSYHQLRG